jgi:hypothetical protein
MAVSVFPALAAAGFEAALAHFDTDVQVSYGQHVTDEFGDYVTIAMDDPDAEWQTVVSSTREWETVGIDADVREEGDIPCFAYSWNGDNDVQAAVERVFSIAGDVIDIFRDTPNLGLIEVSWTLPGRDLVCESQLDDDGAKARLPFSIHYVALI